MRRLRTSTSLYILGSNLRALDVVSDVLETGNMPINSLRKHRFEFARPDSVTAPSFAAVIAATVATLVVTRTELNRCLVTAALSLSLSLSRSVLLGHRVAFAESPIPYFSLPGFLLFVAWPLAQNRRALTLF